MTEKSIMVIYFIYDRINRRGRNKDTWFCLKEKIWTRKMWKFFFYFFFLLLFSVNNFIWISVPRFLFRSIIYRCYYCYFLFFSISVRFIRLCVCFFLSAQKVNDCNLILICRFTIFIQLSVSMGSFILLF